MGAVGNEAGAPPHAWHDWAPIDRSNLSTNVSDHRLPAGRWMASSNGLTWQGGESRGKAYDTEYLKSVLLGETDELGGWKKESHLPPLEERPQDLLRKGAWTDDEDQILREHVATMGEKDWNRIKVGHWVRFPSAAFTTS